MSNKNDFIAEGDIFIDAQGKVVEKKDGITKLASKGARVSPADVEKYGLRTTKGDVIGEGEMGPAVLDQPRQKKVRATAETPLKGEAE